MEKLKDFYTVVVLPNPTSKPYRFRVERKTVKMGLGVIASLALVFLGVMIHYFLLTRGVVELKGLRKETSIQKQQIQTFASELIDLKKKMVRLKEMDAKIRVITDIGPAPESETGLGMGGAEGAGLSELDLGIRTEQLAKKLEGEVAVLKAEALRQEVSFEEITQAVKDQKVVWDSTPTVWPVRGWLSSSFGKRVSPFTGHLTLHKGIDIATRRNTPIIAPASGVVSYKGYDNGLGRIIKINHGHGIQTLYGHLAKADVRVGQEVKRGDVIAFVGNTGMSTGPHLHYTVFANGIPVNPLRYIIN